jgi:hypothetical protein
LEGVDAENVVILHGHLEYFLAIWDAYMYCGPLIRFPCFGMLYQEKSGNPVFPVLVCCIKKNLATLLPT